MGTLFPAGDIWTEGVWPHIEVPDPMGGGAGICQDATPGPTYAPSRDLGAMGLRDTGPVSLAPGAAAGALYGQLRGVAQDGPNRASGPRPVRHGSDATG